LLDIYILTRKELLIIQVLWLGDGGVLDIACGDGVVLSPGGN
jgi:hypothetical protein